MFYFQDSFLLQPEKHIPYTYMIGASRIKTNASSEKQKAPNPGLSRISFSQISLTPDASRVLTMVSSGYSSVTIPLISSKCANLYESLK